MKLPNADRAVVEREKVVDYLLNHEHPDNSGKAEFFKQLGFNPTAWTLLAEAFRALACNAQVTRRVDSPHGQKHIIIGQIETPVGKPAAVQTIWIVDKGADVARLVTAYPHKE